MLRMCCYPVLMLVSFSVRTVVKLPSVWISRVLLCHTCLLGLELLFMSVKCNYKEVKPSDFWLAAGLPGLFRGKTQCTVSLFYRVSKAWTCQIWVKFTFYTFSQSGGVLLNYRAHFCCCTISIDCVCVCWGGDNHWPLNADSEVFQWNKNKSQALRQVNLFRF